MKKKTGNSIFSEIYGRYFRAVEAILAEAVKGTLNNEKRIMEIAREYAFDESSLAILENLMGNKRRWPLLDGNFRTLLRHVPSMPLSTLEKRWLKSLLDDPRIRLFDPSFNGLEDVDPLFSKDIFVYFDRCIDGDPYEDEGYIRNFRTILTSIKEGRYLNVSFTDRKGKRHSKVCIPLQLEYSSKDDKFRLTVSSQNRIQFINLARISSCAALLSHSKAPALPQPQKETVLLEITDERQALTRAMHHFSYLEKEAKKVDDKHFIITLHYYKDDEAEVLIQVLSFGPMLRVIEPASFATKIRERLERQALLFQMGG